MHQSAVTSTNTTLPAATSRSISARSQVCQPARPPPPRALPQSARAGRRPHRGEADHAGEAQPAPPVARLAHAPQEGEQQDQQCRERGDTLPADLHGEHAQQPRGGPEQGDAEHPAQHDHPAARARHALRDRRHRGDGEIGQRQAEAERREHREDLGGPARQRETDGGAEERRRARRRQQGRERAGDKGTPAIVAFRHRADGARQRRGQPDLEPAPQIRREQDEQQRHEDEEGRILELDAPADRVAARLRVPRAPRPAPGTTRRSPPPRRGSSRAPWRAPAPPWLTTLSSLIDSTGSTQGIRLRMSPPSSASASTPSSPSRAGRGGTLCHGQRALGGALAVHQGQRDALPGERVAGHRS